MKFDPLVFCVPPTSASSGTQNVYFSYLEAL